MQDFIDVFCELEKKYSFDDYKIILVESVDEIQSYVGIERIVVQNTLDKELLHVSNKMFDYWGNVYIFSKFAHNNIAKEIDEISDLSGHVMENSCFVHESGGESKIREWRYERFYNSLEKLCSLSKKISEGSLSAHEEKIARKILKKLQGF